MRAHTLTSRHRLSVPVAVLLAAGISWIDLPARAAQVVIDGPPGSGEFGLRVYVLSNGNLVVTDPNFSGPGSQTDIGAVHLLQPNGLHIATLRGAQPGDRVGSGGVTVLDSGHFVVQSPDWQSGAVPAAGAATWCDGERGCEGVVGVHNSLVGSSSDDGVGFRVEALRNGHYVVVSARWDRGAVFDAGAVTRGDGFSGSSGVVDAGNSLVGVRAFDQVGSEFAVLADGDFVAGSPNWNRAGIENAGAATFSSGTNAIVGEVTTANSLVGSSTNDQVGETLFALANGAYVVASFNWNNGAETAAGAATFGSGDGGIIGTVSATNSLVGTQAFSSVGKGGITALATGNYVVASPEWSDGSGADVGAATFGSGSTGVSGIVSAANSLTGRRPGDAVGFAVTPLVNGNYVVSSPFWNDGAAIAAGAVTLGDGSAGSVGEVTPLNSMIGSRANDRVGSAGVIALTDGNYVVASPDWRNASVVSVGAATFVDAASGGAGTVSEVNSLVGTNATDAVGSSVIALPSGGYVVGSPSWDRGAILNAGAATRAPAGGLVGAVSEANSLVGSRSGDGIARAMTAFADGSFVLRSPDWSDAAAARVGAVTHVSAAATAIGPLTPANSLVGSTALDRVGSREFAAFPNGNFLTETNAYDDGGIADAGAVTLGLRDGRVVGLVNVEHSVIGSFANASFDWSYAYDPRRNQLVVGEPVLNRVILHRSGLATTTTIVGDTPDPSVPGASVGITAVVTAIVAPADGTMRFRASDGQECTDAVGVATAPTGTEFHCEFVFDLAGEVRITAEYLDSLDFAYSGSAHEPHVVLALAVFRNGFEPP